MRVNILSVQKLLEKEVGGELKAEEIIENADNITRNIQDYANENDLTVFKILKRLCMRKAMHEETAKMTRNIGMFYFYKNDTKRAFSYINQALRIAKEQSSNNLLIGFLSDKGLIRFYNLQYKSAEKLYLQAFEQLASCDKLDSRVRHLLYYRTGILYSYMNNYANSHAMLTEALKYAKIITDKGWTLVNIGVNYERQGQYIKALEYFSKALKLYREDYTIERSSVYNSIAETYKNLGDYKQALENINIAFDLLECKNMNKFFIFFQTYTAIKVLQGESKEELEKLIELISHVKDFFIFKCFIIDGINIAVKASSQDRKNLSKLHGEITNILDDIGSRNVEYKRELDNFLDNICLSLEILCSK